MAFCLMEITLNKRYNINSDRIKQLLLNIVLLTELTKHRGKFFNIDQAMDLLF